MSAGRACGCGSAARPPKWWGRLGKRAGLRGLEQPEPFVTASFPQPGVECKVLYASLKRPISARLTAVPDEMGLLGGWVEDDPKTIPKSGQDYPTLCRIRGQAGADGSRRGP